MRRIGLRASSLSVLALAAALAAPIQAAAETSVIVQADPKTAGAGLAVGLVCRSFGDAVVRAAAQQPSLIPTLSSFTQEAIAAIVAKRSSAKPSDAQLGMAVFAEDTLVGLASVMVLDPTLLDDHPELQDTLDLCLETLSGL